MQKTCKQCSAAFDVTEDDLAFYDKVSPVFNGKKEPIPPPLHCPQCRLRRRLTFRNPIHVFLRNSSLSGKQIFSMWPANTRFPVYSNSEWWGEAWDPLQYGIETDSSRSFFEQFELMKEKIPHYALSIGLTENSDYCNNANHLKNCYMVFNTEHAEDGMYCEMMNSSRSCVDCTYASNSELCYQCIWCSHCYNVQNAEDCDNCSESAYLLQCRSCTHCFGCVNLRHKNYCIFNEQKTKEEYENFIQSLRKESYAWHSEMKQKFGQFCLQFPRPHAVAINAHDSSGNHMSNVRNVADAFYVADAEFLSNCLNIFEASHCRDYSVWGSHAEQIYEAISCGTNVQNLLFCYECWDGSADLQYCFNCIGCQYCFACCNLHKKSFCIFNKQYSKEEYNMLVPKIIEQMRKTGEWGEFFPMHTAPGPYNCSIAQRYFPITKKEAEKQGLRWYDEELPEAPLAIDASQLPDGLPKTDDPIIVRSEQSGKPFKITPQEIKRYRQFDIPLPRMTYDERMEERTKKLGGIRLYDRTCAKTGKPIKTAYPPDSRYIVWDKDTYDQEFGG